MIYFVTEDSASAKRFWEVMTDNYLSDSGMAYKVATTYGIKNYVDYINNMINKSELTSNDILIAIIDDSSTSNAEVVSNYLKIDIKAKVKKLTIIDKYTAEEIFISNPLLSEWLRFDERTTIRQKNIIQMCYDVQTALSADADYWRNPSQLIAQYQTEYLAKHSHKGLQTKEQFVKGLVGQLTNFIGKQFQFYGAERVKRSSHIRLEDSNLGDCWQLDCAKISNFECKNCGMANIRETSNSGVALDNPYSLRQKLTLIEENSVMQHFVLRFKDIVKEFRNAGIYYEQDSTFTKSSIFNDK